MAPLFALLALLAADLLRQVVQVVCPDLEAVALGLRYSFEDEGQRTTLDLLV